MASELISIVGGLLVAVSESPTWNIKFPAEWSADDCSPLDFVALDVEKLSTSFGFSHLSDENRDVL